VNVFQATDGRSAQVEPLTDPTVDKPVANPEEQAEIRALIAQAEALLARLRAMVA
jgi:hypothetical protein